MENQEQDQPSNGLGQNKQRQEDDERDDQNPENEWGDIENDEEDTEDNQEIPEIREEDSAEQQIRAASPDNDAIDRSIGEDIEELNDEEPNADDDMFDPRL
jgi:hypothetical protein